MANQTGYFAPIGFNEADANDCAADVVVASVSASSVSGIVVLGTGPTELGVDIDGITDFGSTLSLASGLRNLGNALARRLMTPRGGLFYDPNYGTDVRAYMNAGFTQAQLSSVKGEITAEVLQDPRVQSADVSVAADLQTGTMKITIVIDIANGPFELMIGVDALTVDLLSARALT